MKIFELTAKGRYYKVYVDGQYISQHTTEREAIENAQAAAYANLDAFVTYRHEYEVEVGVTNAGHVEDIGIGPATDLPPVILSTPSPSFEEGTANTYDMALLHVSDDGVSTVTYALTNVLPNGLSFNETTGVLDYDGIGIPSVSQHQLTATDAVGSDQSAIFDLTISAIAPAEVSFSASSYLGSGGTNLTVTIIRGGNLDYAFNVDWTLTGVPATPLADTLTFAVSETSKSFQIALSEVTSTWVGTIFFSGSSVVSPYPLPVSVSPVSAVVTVVVSVVGVEEIDWQRRSSQSGVVWYHNFASDAEVDQFRLSSIPGPGIGNDPGDVSGRPAYDPNLTTGLPHDISGTITRITTDGITGGGCMQLLRRDGTMEGSTWRRPYSPLSTVYGTDPGVGGSIATASFDAVQGGNGVGGEAGSSTYTAGWAAAGGQNNGGFWGHPDYWPDYPGKFDGHGYYLQVRVKMTPERRLSRGRDGGKIFYFTRTDQSLTSQEINTRQMDDGNLGHPADFNFFTCYRSGSGGMHQDDPRGHNQIDGEAGVCDFSANEQGGCWYYSEGWDTLLYHVVPMKHFDNQTWFQLWAQKPGETRYTRVWNQRTVNLPFGTGDPKGHNALIFTGYDGGEDHDEFRYYVDEMIFQDDKYGPIAMPRTTKTVIQTAADDLAEGGSVDLAPNPEQSNEDIQWMTAVIYWSPIHNTIQYMGKDASPDHRFMHYQYNCDTDMWSEPTGPNPVLNPTDGNTGHIWCHTIDPIEGDYYWARYNRPGVYRMKHAMGSSPAVMEQIADGIVGGNRINDGSSAPIMGWHPNLFGPGLPGLFALSHAGRLFVWNPVTDIWRMAQEPRANNPIWRRNNGQSVYIPETDRCALFGQHSDGDDPTMWLAAGAGNAINAVDEGYLTVGSNQPPFIISGKSGGQQGKVVNHPENPNKLLLFEQWADNPGVGGVFDSDDYGDTWVKRTSSNGYAGRDVHPFSHGDSPFTIGSLPLQKCVMGIESETGGVGRIMLWKPGL